MVLIRERSTRKHVHVAIQATSICNDTALDLAECTEPVSFGFAPLLGVRVVVGAAIGVTFGLGASAIAVIAPNAPIWGY